MADNSLFMLKLGQELLEDPAKRGYAEKTLEEIVQLVNAPYRIEKIVYDEYPCRVSVIGQGIENAPNFVTVEQVQTLIQMQTNYRGGN